MLAYVNEVQQRELNCNVSNGLVGTASFFGYSFDLRLVVFMTFYRFINLYKPIKCEVKSI